MPQTANTNPLAITPVYSALPDRDYTGALGDYLDAGHQGVLGLGSGTVALSFSMDRLAGDYALISKDGGGRQVGDFTVWVQNGTLTLSMETDTSTKYLKIPDLVLSAHTTYHFAMSFGAEGLALWLDGKLVAAEPEFTTGLTANTHPLVVGASRAWRSSDTDEAHSLFKGTIGDVMVFDQALTQPNILRLTEAVDANLDNAARMDMIMADLAPVFEQAHHGTDTLKEILEDYGVDEHGHLATPLNMMLRGKGNQTVTGTAGDDGINGGRDHDVLRGGTGNDVMQGDYGNDRLFGQAGDDILDGGHGEDTIDGGAGDDLLIARSDAREPYIAPDPTRDEGDPQNELTNGKLYPNQPIPGDDVLIGGAGADIFYFQTLINAKERYIKKHTRDDGTINWHGVAGENDDLHNHWVDHLGDDVVMDYSRAEGDRIVIEGHTTEIASISYGDANGDGVMDHSVIALYSNQGRGGGAHNQDKLGTITVYGDLVKRSDIETTAAPAYGIVNTIDDLNEALKPTQTGPDTGPVTPPTTGIATKQDLNLTTNMNPVFAIAGTSRLSGDAGDYLDAGHQGVLGLGSGTVALSFSMDRLAGDYALISKDGGGRQVGDFTVWVQNGTLTLSMETDTSTKYLKIPDLVLSAHTTYHFAMSFGAEGLALWLDGKLVAAEPEFTTGLTANTHPLVVGASRAWRSSDTDEAHSLFKGTIGDVMVFDQALTQPNILRLTEAVDANLDNAARMDMIMADLAPVFEQAHHGTDTLKEILEDYGVDEHGHLATPLNMMLRGKGNQTVTGTAGDDGINGGRDHDVLRGGTGNDVMQGDYGNDRLFGQAGDDILDGGHGEDTIDGGAGDDLLIARSDAREPYIAPDPTRDEGDPQNELTNGKLYPNQPIPGDDVLIGGAGADIFYFQTLINAKERYIKKHTRDDGTINWHGVAGENDDLHNHWVDHLGDDVVMDYSRAEGDRIVIEGHTTEIASISYGDANGDGVMDHSVIALYSNQGRGGGAHNQDKLGTITVYGDLVKRSDIETTAAPAYGIVNTIDDLNEALKPTQTGPDTGPVTPPTTGIATRQDLNLTTNINPVFAIAETTAYKADDRAPLVFDHSNALDLTTGTIAFSFTADSLANYRVLLTKDASGYGPGGHVSIYVNETGGLTARLQTDTSSHYFDIHHAIETGVDYDVALSFGAKGAEFYLNGALVAYDRDVQVNWDTNTEALIVGASGWSNTPGTTDNIHSHFDGTIKNVMVFDQQLTSDEIFGTPTRSDYLYLNGQLESYAFSLDDNGVVLTRGGTSTSVGKDIQFLKFNDAIIRAKDIQFGSAGVDVIGGEDTAEILVGRGNNDSLRGYDNDDFLFGGTGNDDLRGGDGMDHLFGEVGDDTLYGGNNSDMIFGGRGNDYLFGQDGNDRLYGGLGDDTIYGHEWNRDSKYRNDVVYYDGNRADYTFETDTRYNGHWGKTISRLIVTDDAGGGLDGYYEGRDVLTDVDWVQFADQRVAFTDLL